MVAMLSSIDATTTIHPQIVTRAQRGFEDMTQKPKLTASDWGWARREYELGTPARAIARHLNVTHPAVFNRAKRECWIKPERKPPERALPTSTAPHQLVQSPSYRERMTIEGDDLPVRDRILKWVEEGNSVEEAAKGAEITIAELDTLLADPTFEHALVGARARFGIGVRRHLTAAMERGDTKATTFLLERHPDLRDDFSKEPPSSNVELNVQFFPTKLSASREDLIAAGVIDADEATEIEGEVIPALPPPAD